mmetsp:Transcript_33244/g.43819  ORF Transcript_33244/g.43819 Transcript_33244/m.43819 type:complete len:186 (+) Transcript_33244:210-767(+)
MQGHTHDSWAGTQNQGNKLGDRPCVRQSKLYRMQESGNNVKTILGSTNLCWDTNKVEGAYTGQQIYDHNEERMVSGNLRSLETESRIDLDPRYQAHELKKNVSAAYDASVSAKPSNMIVSNEEPGIGTNLSASQRQQRMLDYGGRDSIDELCFPLNKMAADNESSRKGKASGNKPASQMKDTRPW